MTEQLPVDMPGELPIHQPAMDVASTSQELVADADWPARCRRRVREAMVVIGEQMQPTSAAELYGAVVERVPLTDYDASMTKTGAIRAWTNLAWNLTTNYEHTGWLHVTTSGYRLTSQGRAVLESGKTPQQLYDDSLVGYKEWDERRGANLAPPAVDLSLQIAHRGSGFAHSFAATAPIVQAWRTGASAFSPGRVVWTPASTYALASYLHTAPTPLAAELPGLASDDARLLAAEALALLMAPLSDMTGATKRARVRGPLLGFNADPPGLPTELSADLEQGFVPGGRALIADPLAMLRSFAGLLQHWWSRSEEQRSAAWQDPWIWRDVLADAKNVDERVTAIVSLVVHPGAFTPLLRGVERGRAVDAFEAKLDSLSAYELVCRSGYGLMCRCSAS